MPENDFAEFLEHVCQIDTCCGTMTINTHNFESRSSIRKKYAYIFFKFIFNGPLFKLRFGRYVLHVREVHFQFFIRFIDECEMYVLHSVPSFSEYRGTELT